MIDRIFENSNLSVAILSSLIGLVITLIGFYYLFKSKESKSWDSTEGEILTSDVIKEFNNNSEGNNLMYKPEICYSFSVNGQQFISNKIRIMFNFSTNWSTRAYRLVKKYPINSKVTVFYDANNPEDSVLEPGIKFEIIVMIIIGFLITLISFYFVNNYGFFELF